MDHLLIIGLVTGFMVVFLSTRLLTFYRKNQEKKMETLTIKEGTLQGVPKRIKVIGMILLALALFLILLILLMMGSEEMNDDYFFPIMGGLSGITLISGASLFLFYKTTFVTEYLDRIIKETLFGRRILYYKDIKSYSALNHQLRIRDKEDKLFTLSLTLFGSTYLKKYLKQVPSSHNSFNNR